MHPGTMTVRGLAARHVRYMDIHEWYAAKRATLESHGCSVLNPESERNGVKGDALLFKTAAAQGHVIVWDNGWVALSANEPLEGILDAVADLMLATAGY